MKVMRPKRRKKIEKKPVKALTEAERKLWLTDMRKLARQSTAMRTRTIMPEASFGEIPEAGGTDPAEFFARKDNGSV
jgi:hypothetical protein